MKLVVCLILAFVSEFSTEGFVEEVSCGSTSMTVMLNKSDPQVIRWMQNPVAQPVVYVYGHKARTPCGMSLKTSNGLPNYNLTVPYGRSCSVYLSDLEPDYQQAEADIAVEDNNFSDDSKPIKRNHVFCLYTRRVQALRVNDISTGHEVIASTGGKPKPKVELLFKSTDDRPVRAAKFGDTVKLYLALSPDNAYKGIVPKKCMFSDREQMERPDAKKLTFVQSNCPVNELSEIIDPLSNVNEEVYYTNFKTFRFGNQSTVYAHCTVQVCLDQQECAKSCFHRQIDSNLTAERLRLRFRRQTGDQIAEDQEVSISSALTVLDDLETIEIAGHTVSKCAYRRDFKMYYLLIGILTCLLFVSCLLIGCLTRKLRLQTKEVETRTLCSSAPSSTLGGLDYGRMSPAFSHRSTTLRSMSEINVPRPAWIASTTMPEHYIPRCR